MGGKDRKTITEGVGTSAARRLGGAAIRPMLSGGDRDGWGRDGYADLAGWGVCPGWGGLAAGEEKLRMNQAAGQTADEQGEALYKGI